MITLATYDPTADLVWAERADGVTFEGRQVVLETTDAYPLRLDDDGVTGNVVSELRRLPRTRPVWLDDETGRWHDGRRYIDTANLAVINRHGVFVA